MIVDPLYFLAFLPAAFALVLTPGPDMYGQLIRDMGNALADCLQ